MAAMAQTTRSTFYTHPNPLYDDFRENIVRVKLSLLYMLVSSSMSSRVTRKVHHCEDAVSYSHILVPWWSGIKYIQSL